MYSRISTVIRRGQSAMKRYSNPAETRKSTSLGNDLGEHNAMLAVIGHHILSETLPNAPTYVNLGAEPEDVCVLGCPLIVHYTCSLHVQPDGASHLWTSRIEGDIQTPLGIDRSHPTTEMSWCCLLPSNLGKRNTVTVARFLAKLRISIQDRGVTGKSEGLHTLKQKADTPAIPRDDVRT
ncbi:hypothetical protein IG631_00701 [Alternaria alternata]|nr:hypothetical protein IG631_00701 [Alternaria alternata]